MRPPRPGPPKAFTVLAAVAAAVVGCLGLAGPVGYFLSGPAGLTAAALAGGCCCLGTLAAFGATPRSCGPQGMVASVLVGMIIRMAVAGAAALAVQLLGGPLAEAGFVYYLLVFYLVTLAVETLVVVRSWST